jgi:hypothetical protein
MAGFLLLNYQCVLTDFEDKEIYFPFAAIYMNYGYSITCSFLRL